MNYRDAPADTADFTRRGTSYAACLGIPPFGAIERARVRQRSPHIGSQGQSRRKVVQPSPSLLYPCIAPPVDDLRWRGALSRSRPGYGHAGSWRGHGLRRHGGRRPAGRGLRQGQAPRGRSQRRQTRHPLTITIMVPRAGNITRHASHLPSVGGLARLGPALRRSGCHARGQRGGKELRRRPFRPASAARAGRSR